MKSIQRIVVFLGVVVLLAPSCTESKTTTEEKKEINVMDSTKKEVKEKVEKLEDQTKKVEESLEKLDKEFEEKKDLN